MHSLTTKRAFLIFFAALTILFVAIMWPFAKSAFLAFTLAVIFAPLYRFALKTFRRHRYIAAVFTSLIIVACVILPLSAIAAIFITKIDGLLREIISQFGQGSFAASFNTMVDAVHDLIDKLAGSAPAAEDIKTAIINTVEVIGRKLYQLSPRVFSTTASVMASFLFMFIFLIVFLAEGSMLDQWLKGTVPLSRAHWEELARDVRLMITSSIGAAVIIALVQGSLMGMGFWMVGFKQAFGWWLVAIIMSIIPVVGAMSCYIIASVALMSSGRLEAGIGFLVFGFAIISTVDNIIRPFIVRGSSYIHPLLLFIALIGSVKLMGPMGLLVGPVLLSVFLASLRIYRREFASSE